MEDSIPINEYCYSDEAFKYKFKSNIIDSDIVTDMYKDGNTFDKSLINMLEIEDKEDPNDMSYKDEEAVQILTSLNRDFGLIK